MAATYITITGTFTDASDQPVSSGTVTFTSNETVYAAGGPVVTPDTPIAAQIVGGQLRSAEGGTLELLSTASTGLTIEGRSGFWFWTVTITIHANGSNATVTDGWNFFLPASPSSVDLYSLAGTPAP